MVSRSAEQRLSTPLLAKWSSRALVNRLGVVSCLLTAACGSSVTTLTTTETFTTSNTTIISTSTTTSTQRTLIDVILAAGSGHLEVKTNPGATCTARAVDGSGHKLTDLPKMTAGTDGRIVWEGTNGELLVTPTPPPSESPSPGNESSSNNVGTFIVNCTEPGFLPAATTTATFNLG